VIELKNEITICKRRIGPNYKPFVIPEIGINHDGDIRKAKRMVLDAHRSGAECVKFQYHVVEDEMIPEAKKVIPGNAKESIYTIMERCSLTEKENRELKRYVESFHMIYLCTPFSRAAADILESMGVCAYKIGSGECNNYPLIKHIASFEKPIILSTGMNDISSIRKSIQILKKTHTRYALMHCTSLYPTPYNKVRLGALDELKKNFPNTVIGLSDHSLGNYTCFGAVALGASIVEKHFTSNKNWAGPDVPISITPDELRDLISGTTAIHEALGGKKIILKEEQPTINFAYACVVSMENIKKGEKLSRANIWVKRPGTGEIKAYHYEKLIGKIACKDIPKDTQLHWNQIKNSCTDY
jgi:sialic acid synthase SpsE